MTSPAAIERQPGTFFVEQGSIYAPGWHVRERVRDNYLRSVACFDEKADADEYLAYVLEQEAADQRETARRTACAQRTEQQIRAIVRDEIRAIVMGDES